MPDLSNVDGRTLLGASAAALLVLSLWSIALIVRGVRLKRDAWLMRARLTSRPGEGPRILRLWHDGVASSVQVPGTSTRRGAAQRLRRLHEDLGWAGTWQRTAGIAAGVVAASAVLTGSLTNNAVNGLLAAMVSTGAVFWYAAWRRSSRAALFERQLVDGLELSARALRAGHPLLGSFRLIAEEIDDPVGRLFADVCQRQEMGVDLDQALREAADSSDSADMRLFSASLAIHLRSGGNIADVVEGIAQVIRQRMRLARRVRVLTAQTQLSKRILLGMPVAIFAALHLLNPDYAKVLYQTDSGRLLLLFAIGLMLLGWATMNRMAVVRM